MGCIYFWFSESDAVFPGGLSVVPAFSICSLLLFLRILPGTYIGGTKGMVPRLPFFENKKSAPILEKNTLTVFIYGPNISFQILSLQVKHSKIF